MAQERIELAIKAVRDCHTKGHWDDFYARFGDLLTNSPNQKLVTEVFKKLESDPQSLYYSPQLWGALIQGAMVSWNTEAGVAVAEFSKKLTQPTVSIPAAQVLLEGGKPALSREYAQRALRHSSLSDLERIQLELIVASSFAEEAKTDHAVRVLAKVLPLVRTAEMTQRERADFVVRMGRLQFFMGRYPDAARAFEEAAPLLMELQDWEGAARAFLNSGACINNSGTINSDAATKMVEKARVLSEEHSLTGPLAHCEAFYGVEAFYRSQFMAAREHFRRAMNFLPSSDKTFRRLHIMSFLSLTYFAMGRYALGIKFGRQTLELAALDASERFKTRYQTLEAEILWEEGRILESMETIRASIHPLALHGVKNLEELSTVVRYHVQSAILGETPSERFKIDDSLQRNQVTWLEYQYSSTLVRCSLENFRESIDSLRVFYERAKALDSLNYQALILLAMIRLQLQKHDIVGTQDLLPFLEAAVGRLGDTPIRAKLQFIYAAIAYQSANFEKAIRLLHGVDKMSTVSWPDRFAAQACLSTVRGESPRFQYSWQEQLVARFVRGYFAPNIKIESNRTFTVSDHYRVSLEKHPAMADLIVYLAERSPFGSSLADIQTDVWKESVNAQGWQQKIRNAVMRVRDLFPYTMAPIVVHSDNLRFFGEAIRVVRDHDDQLPMEEKVRQLLRDTPLSSQQVAEKIDVSLATAKRILKKLSDDQSIIPAKQGRNVVYQVSQHH